MIHASDPASFWSDLWRVSGGLVEPCTLPSPVPDIATYEEVHDLLKALGRGSEYDRARGLRVYVDGARRKGNYERALLQSIAGDGTLVSRLDEFCSSEFLAFVNKAGTWSEPIFRRFARLAAPFVDRHPPSSLSLELHLIAGRYSSTPFGAHLDERNDRVLHFNLGPGTKTLHLWDRATYVACHGDDSRCYEPARLLPAATPYALPADRSVFHLPAERFHVGSSPELSLTLSLAVTKRSRRDFIGDLGKRMTTALERTLTSDVSFADFSPEAVVQTADRLSRAAPGDTSAWIDEAVQDAMLLARSNLSFTDLPEPRRTATAELRDSAVLRRADPFPILVAERGDTLTLFLRGRAVQMRRAASVVAVVEELQHAIELPTERALSILGTDLAPEAALGVLKILSDHRALDASSYDGSA